MKQKKRTTRRDNPLLCVATFGAAHGVRGHIKIHSHTQDPETLPAYAALFDRDENPLAIRFLSRNGATWIAEIKGINDRDEAQRYTRQDICIHRDALPEAGEGEYYHADLMGLEARHADGSLFGAVKALHNFGAGDIIEITLTNGQTEMFPFAKDVVPEVCVDKGYLILRLPEEK